MVISTRFPRPKLARGDGGEGVLELRPGGGEGGGGTRLLDQYLGRGESLRV